MIKRSIVLALITICCLCVTGCTEISEMISYDAGGNGNITSEIPDDTTQAEITDGWVSNKLAESSGKAVFAKLPPDLTEMGKTSDAEESWSTMKENYVVQIDLVAFSVDPELSGTNWANTKIDSSSDLTASELWFQTLCNDADDRYSGMFSAINIEPRKQYKEEEINGVKWLTYKMSGVGYAPDPGVGMDLTITHYSYCGDTENVNMRVIVSFDPENISSEEKKMLKDYIKVIPETFEIKDV